MTSNRLDQARVIRMTFTVHSPPVAAVKQNRGWRA